MRLVDAPSSLLVVLVVVVASACGTSSHEAGSPTTLPAATTTVTASTTTTTRATLQIAGRRIAASGLVDVADAIRRAGLTVPDGHLLAVVSHRVLGPNGHSAAIMVNGSPATTATAVHGGDVITFIPGTDTVEPTQTVRLRIALDPAAAALYTSTQPGSVLVVRGTVSGEQVSSALQAAPTIGHLRAPAQVALSFDDGPSATYTAQVLSLLTSHRIPAVFCLIGRDALAYPDLVRREVSAGDRVCDHTQTHPLDLPALSPAQIAAEIHEGEQSILAVDGDVAPTYFRAPGGNWSPTIESDARADHLIPLSWTVDPRDWSQPGTQTIVTRVLDQLRPDGIVLLHDGGGDRAQTLAALATLLAELSGAGWTFTFPTWVH
ncbi:MAG TPA: polysaccharide deacetylase family protein [Acidimicrobiales bacterium]|nr:polysaccharide deacetylase family protein [Acidimicrobiales bacterium]